MTTNLDLVPKIPPNRVVNGKFIFYTHGFSHSQLLTLNLNESQVLNIYLFIIYDARTDYKISLTKVIADQFGLPPPKNKEKNYCLLMEGIHPYQK